MIFFGQDLRIGENAAREKGRIIRDIRKHNLQLGVYVIALCANGKDILDIIPSYMLGKDNYKGHDITVLGLAKGREEAFDLAGQMILEAMNHVEDVCPDDTSEPLGGKLRRYFQ